MQTVPILEQTGRQERGRTERVRSALRAAYRDLSLPQARELAHRAIGLEGREQAEEILLCLACMVPGSLDGIHGELLHREWFYPPVLFRGADPDTRDRLFELLDSHGEPDSVPRNHWLLDLAWIGDEGVQGHFHAWRSNPPCWRPYLHIPPENYAHEAGWELAGDGRRRDLFHRECYVLEAGDVPATGADADSCLWCRLPMVTLFDLDLRDPRLEFLGIPGEKLRLGTCNHCVIFTTLFLEIDTRGRYQWSNYNLRPTGKPFYDLPAVKDQEPWLPRGAELTRLSVVGEPRRSPFETEQFVASWLELSVSQVGGHPMWIQDAEYPRCPGCQETMKFVGQHQDRANSSDQILYAFLCPPCKLAATVHQSS